jgi:hypothetical protein
MQPTNTKPSKGLLVGWDLNRSLDRLCRRCNSKPLPYGDRAPGAPHSQIAHAINREGAKGTTLCATSVAPCL